MWYLIVPPIVIVVALALLLWYLSRRAADPQVRERVEELEAAPSVRFSGIKVWYYRLLEKFAQRSKTRSLRMHNALHDWLQSIRASRQKMSKSRTAFEAASAGEGIAYESEIVRAQTDESRSAFEEAEEPIQEKMRLEPLPADQGLLDTPIVRRRLRLRKDTPADHSSEEAITYTDAGERRERPMVSEHITRPESHTEARRRRTMKEVSPEESLIAQIANNPKDFAAYEALGDYYMAAGNIKDAKECYRQVLKLSPVHRMVKIKIRRLEKLLGPKA